MDDTAAADTAPADIAVEGTDTFPADTQAVVDNQAAAAVVDTAGGNLAAADKQAAAASGSYRRSGPAGYFDWNTDNYYSWCLNAHALYRVPAFIRQGRDFPTLPSAGYSQSRCYVGCRIVGIPTGVISIFGWNASGSDLQTNTRGRPGTCRGPFNRMRSAAARITSLLPRVPQYRLKLGNRLSSGSCL